MGYWVIIDIDGLEISDRFDTEDAARKAMAADERSEVKFLSYVNDEPVAEPADLTISAEDVKFLRWARKQYRCWVNITSTLTSDGRMAYTEAHVGVETRTLVAGQWVEGEAKRTLPVAHTYLHDYRGSEWANRLTCVDGHATTRYGSTGLVLNLLDAGLRAGDTLRVYWLIGNDTENLRQAGLTHDSCFVQLQRAGNPKGEFLADDRIVPVSQVHTSSFSWREEGV